jgi:hypothetical protein
VRTRFRVLAAAAATSIGFLAFTAIPAMASITAPDCESGGSAVECIDLSGGTAPFTWTITERFEGTSSTYSYTTSTSSTRFGCERGQSFSVSYSYVAGGVTQKSPSAGVICSTGPWE